MLILFVVVGVSWRLEWIGGLVFTSLALAYAYVARAHISWIAVVSGPLLVAGILFLASWLHRRELGTT